MAYSQFKTLKSVRDQLGVKVDFQNLFESTTPVEPSDWLRQTIELTTRRRTAFFSEKSRSEGIVFPILFEALRRYENLFSLYSGAILEADPQKGLNGECDFLVSLGQQSIELERPLIAVVEAKDNDIELGIPQCIAQMVGANIFNEAEKTPTSAIYGASTTADTWVFMKLQNGTVIIDNRQYYLGQLDLLLGVFDSILKDFQ